MVTKPKVVKPTAKMQDPSKIAGLGMAKKARTVPASAAVSNLAAPKLVSVKAIPPAAVNPTQPVPAQTTKALGADAGSMKKKDLIDRVMATTGAKKSVVREIVEATLTVLGDALSKGTMLNLPPFGKAKVSRPSDALSGKAMTVKLRRGQGAGKGAGKASQALADAED